MPDLVARDAVLGLLAGTALGGGIGAGYAYHETHKPNCGDLCGLNWLFVPILGAIGGGTGLVTGGILGATVNRESYWLEISLPMSIR